MAKRIPELTKPPREKAFLVGVQFHSDASTVNMEDSLEELALLADTAGIDIVGETWQKMDRPNAETLIGSGKVEEVKALVEETLAEVVIFDSELSPRHQRELEEKMNPGVRVIDRTALILDIFAQHAQTREGILQVELAQYEYRLPRLTRAWTHLARQGGGASGRTGSAGGVGLRGPGETQLEVDRREIRQRITNLKKELEKVRAHRMRYRFQRKRSLIPVIALVGYTNAGKSSLLNRITSSNVLVANQLFATLDPTTRRVQLPGKHAVLFTDTVGFIQKLPTQLIAAFRATLEEITEADLLIHLVDQSHPAALSQWESVKKTLEEIGAGEIPVITALNKTDRLTDTDLVRNETSRYDNAIAISAKTGDGIPELTEMVEKHLFDTYIPINVKLPYTQGSLISLFHEQGQIDTITHGRLNISIKGSVPGRLLVAFHPYLARNQPVNEDEI